MLCLIVSDVVTSNWKQLLGRYPLHFVKRALNEGSPGRTTESGLETSLAYKSVPISPPKCSHKTWNLAQQERNSSTCHAGISVSRDTRRLEEPLRKMLPIQSVTLPSSHPTRSQWAFALHPEDCRLAVKLGAEVFIAVAEAWGHILGRSEDGHVELK